MLRPKGIEIIELFVNVDNKSAQGFYKKVGYQGRNKFFAMHKKIA